MKKMFYVMLVVILASALGLINFAEAEGPKYKWKWAHIYPTDSDQHKRSETIKKEIFDKSDGRINLTVYPAAQLGDWIEIYEQVMRGSIELALVPVSTLYDPRLNFTWMPYLIDDYASAKKAFGRDGFFYKTLEDLLVEQDIKLLAVWSQGLAGVALTKIPPSPGNPNVAKGIKVRVPGLKAFQVSWEALGYIPTPIPLTDTYTAIQTGVVDGEAGGGSYQAWAQFRDVTKCWVQYNDYFEIWMFGMSLKLWNSISAEDQQIIQSACLKQADLRFDFCEQDDKTYMDKLRKEGVKVITLTPDELAACSKKVRSEGWPVLEETIGKSLMDKIKTAVGVK